MPPPAPAPEIHGDWQVACADRATGNYCSLVQQQTNAGRQRVLAIELTRVGNAAEGMLVLPFGLNLERGARLSVDAEGEGKASTEALPALRFSTCIPAGCLVPLKFAPALIAQLRTAALLKVQATTVDGGETAVFSISLRGFDEAFDRVAVLKK
ncbi:MAG: invasion associated locus B family protein [Pseudomonadota bacterium]